MDQTELLRISIRAIRTNKTRSALTALGIIIGVASVILLVSIGSGLQNYVTQQFNDLGANLVFVMPGKVKLSGGGGRPMTFTSKFTFEDVRALRRIGDPIKRVTVSEVKAGTAKYRNKAYDVTINGSDEDFRAMRNLAVESGTFITNSMVERSQFVVIVGAKVVTNLFATHEDPIGKLIDVSGDKFRVVGVMKSTGGGIGGSNDQDSFVYIPMTTAQKLFGSKNPGAILLQATDSDSVPSMVTKAKNYFYRRHLTDDDFTVLEPKQILDTVNSFLGVITGALSGIAAISLVVGGIGIANIMFVSVTERTREIGLRKALGATRRDILMQFLIESLTLSVLGGGVGIIIGSGFSALLNHFIETSVTLNSVLLSFGISAAVGVISGIAPAIRAGNLNPIDALRYE